jgi:tetratricopeptide (TPR) repeat protein
MILGAVVFGTWTAVATAQTPGLRRAQALQDAGRYEEALSLYRRILDSDPMGAERALYKIGETLALMDRSDEAESWLRKFLGEYPSSSLQDYALYWLGSVILWRNDPQPSQAISYLRLALERTRDIQLAHKIRFSRAEALRLLGNEKGAADELRALLAATDLPEEMASAARELLVQLSGTTGDPPLGFLPPPSPWRDVPASSGREMTRPEFTNLVETIRGGIIENFISAFDAERRFFGIDFNWTLGVTAALQDITDQMERIFPTVTRTASRFASGSVRAAARHVEELILEQAEAAAGPLTAGQRAALRSEVGRILSAVEGGTAEYVERQIEEAVGRLRSSVDPADVGQTVVETVLIPNIPHYISAFKGALLYEHAGLSGAAKATALSLQRDLHHAGLGHLGIAATPALVAFYLGDMTGAGRFAQMVLWGRGKLEAASSLVNDLRGDYGPVRQEELLMVHQALFLATDACRLLEEGYRALGREDIDIPEVRLGPVGTPRIPLIKNQAPEKAAFWGQMAQRTTRLAVDKLAPRTRAGRPHLFLAGEVPRRVPRGGEAEFVFDLVNEGGFTDEGFLSVTLSDELELTGVRERTKGNGRAEFMLYREGDVIRNYQWKPVRAREFLLDVVEAYGYQEANRFVITVTARGRPGSVGWVRVRAAFRDAATGGFRRDPAAASWEHRDQQGWYAYEIPVRIE